MVGKQTGCLITRIEVVFVNMRAIEENYGKPLRFRLWGRISNEKNNSAEGFVLQGLACGWLINHHSITWRCNGKGFKGWKLLRGGNSVTGWRRNERFDRIIKQFGCENFRPDVVAGCTVSFVCWVCRQNVERSGVSESRKGCVAIWQGNVEIDILVPALNTPTPDAWKAWGGEDKNQK